MQRENKNSELWTNMIMKITREPNVEHVNQEGHYNKNEIQKAVKAKGEKKIR